jgi:parvulin-like peptidyl-prolyl isomerase
VNGRLRRSLGALLVSLALVSTACARGSYAAKVGGHRISEAELENELRSIAGNERYLALVEEHQGIKVRGEGAGTFDAAFTALALTRQIYYRLVESELDRRNLGVGREQLQAAQLDVIQQLQGEEVFGAFPRSYQEELVRREAELDVLTLAVNDVRDPEAAARRYYDEHPQEFARACARHILVPDQAKADEIKRRLDAGEGFEQLARAESKDPGSAADGGFLGCELGVESGFVPEFILAVLNQPVGAMGAPVRTQFGFHLVKVDSRQVPPYEGDIPALALSKLTAAGEQKVQDLLRELIAKTRIEVNPRYGQFEKESRAPGVRPPEAPSVTLEDSAQVDSDPGE